MERRPLLTRLRWGNLARVAFVLVAVGLVLWRPGPGDPPALPPDVGLPPPDAVSPPPAPPPRPARKRRRAPHRPARTRHTRARKTVVPPPPVAAPAPQSPPGGEFAP